MPHANLDALCPSIASEWDRLMVDYTPQDLLSFCHRKYAIAKKNEGKIE